MRWTKLLAGVGLLIATGGAARADLLANGSFETGDFTGWNVSGAYTNVSSGFGAYGPESGSYFASMGTIGCCGTISQTVTDTAGQMLSLSYYLASQGDTSTYFAAQWNGSTLAGSELSDPNSGGAYVAYRFNVAATGSDTLTFVEQDNPSYMALDNISLAPAANVPEPVSLSVLGLGLAALSASRLGRKRA